MHFYIFYIFDIYIQENPMQWAYQVGEGSLACQQINSIYREGRQTGGWVRDQLDLFEEAKLFGCWGGG